MKRIALTTLALGLFLSTAAAGDFSFAPTGIRTRWAAVPTGLDLELGYVLPPILDGEATYLDAKLGGGWEDRSLFRDKVSGAPLPLVDSGGKDTKAFDYTWVDFQWDIALFQGLVPGGFKADLLEAFLAYRGRFENTLEGAGTTPAFGDWDRLFYTGFMAGLRWNGQFEDAHGLLDGLYAEAALELAPGALNADLASFWRASAKASYALPLFGVEAQMSGFQGYLVDFASIDYAGGEAIPAYVNQSFGGLDLRNTLGDCVRGYLARSYDSQFKAVNNLEFRVNGPAFLKDKLYPIAFAFVDAGYYRGFSGAPSSYAQESGILASAGAGLGLSVLDLVQLSAVVAQPFTEKDSFWWAIRLFLHF